MFWIVTGIVILALLGLAWISSGFQKLPSTFDMNRGDTAAQGDAASRSATNQTFGSGFGPNS